jgi:hypothetical protein
MGGGRKERHGGKGVISRSWFPHLPVLQAEHQPLCQNEFALRLRDCSITGIGG